MDGHGHHRRVASPAWLVKTKPPEDCVDSFLGITAGDSALLLTKVAPRTPNVIGIQGLRVRRRRNNTSNNSSKQHDKQPLQVPDPDG